MSLPRPVAEAPWTERQALLLRAATLPGARALAAWQAWHSAEPLSRLEPHSQWLLPLLYCNLRQAGVAEAPLRRYGNVYRHHWYKNQLLLRAASGALSGLEDTWLLGAAALATSCYSHLGARPIDRVRLRCADPSAAARRLAVAGWQSRGDGLFTNALGQRIELGEPLPHASALRARARPVRLGGARLRALSALDQLVYVLAAGEAWDERSRLLWAADAAQLLQPGGEGLGSALPARASALGLAETVRENWRRLGEILDTSQAGWP